MSEPKVSSKGSNVRKARKGSCVKCSLLFEAVNIESLFPVLDAIAWLDLPDVKQVAQFAGIDPRTAGKLLKNCLTIRIVQTTNNEGYALTLPYPYKGSPDQKQAVVREALVRMPLMTYIRQFMTLGDNIDDTLRKAATLVGVSNYDARALTPLVKWAKQLHALEPSLVVQDLVDEAVQSKLFLDRLE